MSLIYLFLCSTFLIQTQTNAQISEGVHCETPDQKYGNCLNIDNCPFMLNLLLSQSETEDPKVVRYLKESSCGFIGSTLLVCCPQQRTVPPLLSSTTSRPTSLGPTTRNTPSLPSPPNCGFSNGTNPRVVNGIPAKLGEFPWIVALGYRNPKNPDSPKWLCGGSLITNRHILTAGHCVYNRADLYTARLGDLDLYSDDDGASPSTIPLASAKIHENYSPVNFTNDIAILTLQQPNTNPTAWPICLPVTEPLRTRSWQKNSVFVAGWGSLYFNGPSSSHLQVVSLPVVDNDKCKRAYAGKSVIDERVLCAGYEKGGKDACRGDSGGPLMRSFMEEQHLVYYQIGVVSYGFRCAEAGYPGVYTNTQQFVEWIQRNIN